MGHVVFVIFRLDYDVYLLSKKKKKFNCKENINK